MVAAASEGINLPARKSDLASFLINGYLDAWIVLILAWGNHAMLHWFLIPTFFCGILIGSDAVRWVAGEYDLFDPKGILGGLGWHLFFLAPLLFIYWGVGMRYVVNPPDWRPWVGFLSCLNGLALLFYHSFQAIGYKTGSPGRNVACSVNGKRSIPWFFLFIVLAAAAQAYYFLRLGGVGGILDLTSTGRQTGTTTVSGMGLYEILGGSIPIVLLIMLSLAKAPENTGRYSRLSMLLLLFVLGPIQFLLGGLRGSRSSTVWSLFWIAGTIHYFWRPLSRRFAGLALLLLLSFMYGYGFYKGNTTVQGMEALLMLSKGSTFSDLEEQTGRSLKEMLVADMARVDTQSFQLYRLSVSTDYRYRWGSTYLSSFFSFIPGWIWAGRPPEPEKIAAGTELFYGQGSYVPGDKFQNSQKVYGLGGEALLNFGWYAFPVPFALWGFWIGRYRRSMLAWQAGDFRWFFAPFLTLLFVIALIGDFYNVLGFVVSKGLFPIALFVFTLIMFGNRGTIEKHNVC